MLQYNGPTQADLPMVLAQIAHAIQRITATPPWQPDTEYKINLILEELATNTISYGAPANTPPADLSITITPTPRGANLDYKDSGTPFNPLQDAPPPPTQGPTPADITIGGQGLLLVKHMAEKISYRRINGLNSLSITVLN